MKKKKILSALLLTVMFCGTAGAEVIKGPASLVAVPHGKVVLTVTGDLTVETTDLRGPWRKVGIIAYVAPDIPKGTQIYDKDGKSLGKVEEHFAEEAVMSKPDSAGRVLTSMIFYADVRDIRPESVVESELQKLLNTKKSPTLSSITGHIKSFDYQKWSGYKGVESYGVYENWMDDFSPGFRVLLVFRKGKLAAVMHTRKIDYPFVSSKPFDRGLELSYVVKLPDDEAGKMEKFYSDIFSYAD